MRQHQGEEFAKPLCACMIDKQRWHNMPPRTAKALATAVFMGLRTCPYCRLRGRGKWGRITDFDLMSRGLARPPEPSGFRRLLFAAKIGVSAFVDALRLADQYDTGRC